MSNISFQNYTTSLMYETNAVYEEN